MSKEKLSFNLNGTVFGYEGSSAPAARQKDFLDFAAKMKVDSGVVVSIFRDNLPDSISVSDGEVLEQYAECVDRRKKKAAAKKAPPQQEETVQKLSITIQGQTYAYEGLPSNKPQALAEFVAKMKFADNVAIDVFAENQIKMSKDDIVALVDEKRKARAAKKAGKSAAQDAPSTPTAPATKPPPKEEAQSPVAASSTFEDDTTNPDHASINHFIKEVLETPDVDITARIKSLPVDRPAATATSDSVDASDKVAIYCQEEGAPTSKIIYAPRAMPFKEFLGVVERKFGKTMRLAFFEGSDKIEIDDDDVLRMCIDQQSKKDKIRVQCFPLIGSAQAPEAANGGKPILEAPQAKAGNGTVSYTEVKTYAGHTAAIYAVAFSPDGQRFCSASRDHNVFVWNVDDGLCTKMKGGHSAMALTCDFSPSGEHVVSGSEDASIKIWNAKTGSKSQSLKGHEDKVYSVKYNRAGTCIVSGSCDRTVRVWNAQTGSKMAVLKGHSLPVFSTCFSQTDGGVFVASGSDDRLIKIWDWKAGTEERSLIGHTGTIWSCQFSSDDKQLISTSMDHEINLWDIASGAVIRQFLGHRTPIHHAIFTHDDKYVLSCARDWSVIVWERETGNVATTITGHKNTVFHMSLHKNMLLTSSLDISIKLWALKFE